MKILFMIDANGIGYVAAIDPSTEEHRKAATVQPGQQVTLDVAPDVVLSADQIGFGDVVDSEAGETGETGEAAGPTTGGEEAKEPADKPGGGNEGSPEGALPTGAEGEGGGAPAQGQGEAGKNEPAKTSAASEKPLYILEGDTPQPEGFELSGLETPDGKVLFVFNGDTAGQTATGNTDGVSVYADANDNEQPVKPAEQPAA
jgi:hypothetical protein